MSQKSSFIQDAKFVSGALTGDTLQERDAAVERWLRDAVVPVYDAMQADPGRGRSAGQVADRLRAHHEQRLKKDRA